MKTIVYYTSTYFLDATLQYLELISKDYRVILFLQIDPNSKNANIFNLNDNLKTYPNILSLDDAPSEWNLQMFFKYFKKYENVYFNIFKNNRNLSFDSSITSLHLVKFLKNIKFDYLQFEGFESSLYPIIPYLYKIRKKVILNIHDPEWHIGEESWSKSLCLFLLYRFVKKYVVYSNYCKFLLIKKVNNKSKIFSQRLMPFSFYRNFTKFSSVSQTNITFFGRLSYYKGIDLFLNSISEVNNKYPQQQYIVAGKRHSYNIDDKFFKLKNINFIEKHLSNEELVKLVMSSSLIVCPYIEATQSGVVMTAYALNKPVLVTNVGGLPEYVIEGTGFVCEPEIDSLVNAISEFLSYKNKNKNKNKFEETYAKSNLFLCNKTIKTLKKLYSNN